MDSFIFDIVVWGIISALIGVMIGQWKGRPVGGLILSLLLGPIGWLLVAVGPNMKSKCPDCGGVIVKGAKKCKNCGATVGFDPQQYEQQKAKGEMKKCPHCAEVVKVDAKTCRYCGKDLPQPTPKFKTRQEYEKWKSAKMK